MENRFPYKDISILIKHIYYFSIALIIIPNGDSQPSQFQAFFQRFSLHDHKRFSLIDFN